MTYDVWKEKECVVVDFDPAIKIKMIDKFDDLKIISIRIIPLYAATKRVHAYFINRAKSLCIS